MIILKEVKGLPLYDGREVSPFHKAILYYMTAVRNKLDIKRLLKVYLQEFNIHMMREYFQDWVVDDSNKSTIHAYQLYDKNELIVKLMRGHNNTTIYEYILNGEKLNPTPKSLGHIIEIFVINDIPLKWKI